MLTFLSRFHKPKPLDTRWEQLITCQGGIHKRIDENRELLALLLREERVWIESQPSILEILNNHDQFLCTIHNHCPGLAQATLEYKKPRPWPLPLPRTRTEYIARIAETDQVALITSHPFETQCPHRFRDKIAKLKGAHRRLVEHQTLSKILRTHLPFLTETWWVSHCIESHEEYFTYCQLLQTDPI